MNDLWTMVINNPDGTTKTFSGEKDVKSLLIGVKQYLEKQRHGCNSNSSVK